MPGMGENQATTELASSAVGGGISAKNQPPNPVVRPIHMDSVSILDHLCISGLR